MTVTRVLVHGLPIPQGSKTVASVNGRSWVRDSNDRVLRPWRRSVAAACSGRVPEPLDGPLVIRLLFVFPPPVSASKRRRLLPATKSTGDLDKLVRAVFDGMTTGGLIRDDARICGLVAAKVYGATAHDARVQIEAQAFDEAADGSGPEWPGLWRSIDT